MADQTVSPRPVDNEVKTDVNIKSSLYKKHSSILSTDATTVATNISSPEFPEAMHVERETSPAHEQETGEIREEETAERKRACYIKVAVALVFAGFVVFVIVDSQTNRYVRSGITAFLEWIQENPGAGVVAFMLVYFVATVLFIPGSILTLGAGFVFSASFHSLGLGVFLGALSVFLGASSGAIAAFLLGRYLFRDAVGALTKKYSIFEALDQALAVKGFRIMVLLRLSPVVPFTILNYVASATAVSFWKYCLATLGILPGTILYVFLGASAGSLADSANSGDSMTVTIIVIVVGLVFGIAAIALTSYYARKELNRLIATRQEELVLAQQQDEENGREGDSSMKQQYQSQHQEVELRNIPEGNVEGQVSDDM